MKIFKYVKNSYWIKSGSLSILNRSSQMIFGLINFMLLIRFLSKEDFGIWLLFMSLAAIIELMITGFIRIPLIRLLSISDDRNNPIVQFNSFIINISITLIIIVLIFLSSSFLAVIWESPEIKSLLRYYIFTIVLFIPLTHIYSILNADMDYYGPLISSIFRRFSFTILILLFYFFNNNISLHNLIFSLTISVLLGVILGFFYAKNLFNLKPNFNKNIFSQLFNQGKYTFATNISSMTTKNLDGWMLGFLMTPVAVALYGPAIKLSNIIEVPLVALTGIMLPKLVQNLKINGTNHAKYMYEKTVGYLLAYLIPPSLIIFCFTDEIIRLIAGSGFDETNSILKITLFYGLFIPFNRIFGIIMDSVGKSAINFKLTLIIFIINIINNYFFIIYFGVVGAAIGTLIGYVLSFIFTQFYLNKFYNVRFINSLKWIYKAYNNLILLFYKSEMYKF